MPRANCLIREQPHYRREAFVAGLQKAGFVVRHFDDPKKDDVLVIWNRYGTGEAYARKFESVGAKVVVAENGYIGKDKNGIQFYALALEHHVGAGKWASGRVGEEFRFPKLGVELRHWREVTPEDGELVILPQRGIGPASVAMPADWPEQALAAARKLTDRHVRIRPHPGNNEPQIPLEVDLANAHAAIIWASSAGVKALALGVPVFYAFPKWIMGPAALPFPPPGPTLEVVKMDDKARADAFERLAWAQWTVEEIATGDPFRRLLGLDR